MPDARGRPIGSGSLSGQRDSEALDRSSSSRAPASRTGARLGMCSGTRKANWSWSWTAPARTVPRPFWTSVLGYRHEAYGGGAYMALVPHDGQGMELLL